MCNDAITVGREGNRTNHKGDNMNAVITEKAGRRTYFTGNTYAVREIFQYYSAKWDAERKAWWFGNKKAERILKAIASQDGQSLLNKSTKKAKPAARKSTGNQAPAAQVRYAIALIRKIGAGWHATDAGQFGDAPTESELRGYTKSEISELIADLKA